ncbi:4-hydroxy-tetrahydrodipicolinate synthase [Glaciecola sp. XM2]|uniref:4-hydroxy-tetrahydrodipicolinate synthase n=1 Tax=Glaciecola sp. XM2 TaxID=1914931 RepID=UPI001BDE317E|nr:4-hydroxy-tetrahydrodipicolinate synthase [Glaciecola sp. XM2]MBT1449593.1 4-hydroxy-tetrahydrodipicolinate synthase [Glaciecola sp. XM2]
MFKGSYVALVTPMLPNGEIDKVSLQDLVEWHIASGTHGIVAVGTTGESATLPMDEHIDVVGQIVDYAQGKVPVIAGSGANSTDEAILLSKEMAQFKIDGFLSVVPYYNKPQQRGMIAHFEAIAEATDLPTMLYNVPGRTVADMLTETVAVLAKHPNIVGLKDATGDLKRFDEAKQMLDSDFLLFSGDDATGCEFMCRGGDGVISVSANVAPSHMSKMCEQALAGDTQQAILTDAEIAQLHHLLFIEPNPVMPKWALYKMGMIRDAFLRLPMVLPELSSQKQIEESLFKLGMVK